MAGKAIYEYAVANNQKMLVYSMYDPEVSNPEPYLPKNIFKGFSGNKSFFVLKSLQQGSKSRVIILLHVKLLLAGYLVKLFSKNTKLVLIAHGKEVWGPLSSRQKKMLSSCDLILPVSRFTKKKMKELFHIPAEKLTVLNNCLDPYLPSPSNNESRQTWRKKYGLQKDAIVLMTLSRLTIHEKNKGYDKILVAIKELLPSFPNLQYLLVGKYDAEEKTRLDKLIYEMGIDGKVFFSGFVPDDELADHYNMCDVYIMPSEKEGFGISFIEALYYYKPVIAGNRDGTTDALLDGRLGLLIDPGRQEDITSAIKKVIENISAFIPDRELLMKHFSYEVYRENWRKRLNVLIP